MKIAVIIFAFLYVVHCKPSDHDKDDEYREFQNDNDLYEDYGDQEEEVAAPAVVEEKPVRMKTQRQEFLKNINDSLTLPCETSGTSDFVRIWQKGPTLLFQGELTVHKVANMELLKDGSLKITNLQQEDGGQYKCTAAASSNNSQSVTHTVVVKRPPTIEYLMAEDNKTTLKTGDTLKLSCKANGIPQPNISWHRGSTRLLTSGNTFEISKIHHRDAGTYRCLADNGVGNPDHKNIDIKVHYKPVVSVERMAVNSENNLDTELECIVHSEPKAQVFWKKDNVPITNNDHTRLSTEDNNHMLLIKGLVESDFGTYTCVAKNHLGETKNNIKLQKTPAIARFIEPKNNTKDVVLAWEVQSLSPISQHELQFRKKGEDHWEIVQPEAVENVNNSNRVYVVKYILKGLDAGEYETRIRTENKYGWAEHSKTTSFTGVSKHGHQKHHKKHKDGREKHVTPSPEITTRDNLPLKSDAPAEHQESDAKDASMRADSSGQSSITSLVLLISIALIFVFQAKPQITLNV